jgi:predicted enzyme related to lactoylglutathione lyase
MPTVSVRYIVNDIDKAIAFYCNNLGFTEVEVSDLDQAVNDLRVLGVHVRNDIIDGVGGRQVLIDDPSGNPIELFQPTREEAKLGRSD